MTSLFISGLGFEPSIAKGCLPAANLDIALVPRDSTLIAWSLGGLFAISFCAKHPGHCKKLILLASTPAFLARDNWPGISIDNATALQKKLSETPAQFDSRFLSLVQFPDRSLSLKKLLKAHYQTPSPAELDFLFATDLRHEFATLTTPTQLYLAENDAIIPSKKLLPAIQKLNPRIETTLVKNASHYSLLSKLEHEKSKIARAFNRAANTYNDSSNMQQFAGKQLINQLDKTKKEDTILDLGCGTGLITNELIKGLQFAECDAIDIAQDALDQAKSTITNDNIRFLLQDFDQLNASSKSYSLIFSNMALHWSNDFFALLTTLYKQLSSNGTLAFSVPLTGTLKELNQQNIKPFHDPAEIVNHLNQSGFMVNHVMQHQYIDTFDHITDALYSLKKTGVTQFKSQQQAGLRGKNYFDSLYQSDNKKPQLTYEIGIFIGKKS